MKSRPNITEQGMEGIRRRARTYAKRHKKQLKKYRIKHKVRTAKYAKDNPQIFRDCVNKKRRRNVAEVNLLKSQPCMDCGKSYHPCVMDFDHVRGKKKFCVSIGISRYNIAIVLKEIAKCDLVCSNCHRMRTHNRRQN